MKKLFTLIALLGAVLNFYAQHKVAAAVNQRLAQKAAYKQVSPLDDSHSAISKYDKVVTGATQAVLRPEVLLDIVQRRYDNLELSIPYQGNSVILQLYRVEIAAEGFHAMTDKQSAISMPNGVHYRGIIKGDNTSITSFSFYKEEMTGVISSKAFKNLVVGKLHRAGNFSEYIIYSDANLTLPFAFECHAPEPVSDGKPFQRTIEGTQDVQSDRCVTMYFEIDNDIYIENFSDTTLTLNWMQSIFNNVQTLFANDGITVALKSVFIWTEPDPYTGEASSDYLLQFYQMRPVFDGDVGQLIGIDPGGLGGIASSIGGLCSEYNFSYADVNINFQEVPVYSFTIEAMTHEFGHLMGSPHTHGCYWNGNNTAIDGCGTSVGYIEGNCEQGPIPSDGEQGTIMSYCHLVEGVGIGFANGFGVQPSQRILNHVNSSLCLSTDCINTCINTVRVVAVTETTADTATILWTDEVSEGPWEVAYAEVGNAFTNWELTNENTHTFEGLEENTYYTFGVRPLCPEETEGYALETIFATGAAYCSGINFTDTGGPFGNYPNNQYFTRTLVPDAAGEKIIVTFSEFDLEVDFDYLYVYDGPDTDAPLLGAFTGDEIPGPFQSTAEDGSLTFEFESDQFITESGWNAMITCTQLDVAENELTGFAYYPNPTTGIVTIKAAESFTDIFIYNVTGQLLVHKKVTGAEVNADITPFASGVYFFKVAAAGAENNFRIIKQ